MLKESGQEIAGKKILISGSGNVATHAAEKCIELGGKPITLSDSGGFIICETGFTNEHIEWIKVLKEKNEEEYQKQPTNFLKLNFTKA